jgi:hypothetical protein
VKSFFKPVKKHTSNILYEKRKVFQKPLNRATFEYNLEQVFILILLIKLERNPVYKIMPGDILLWRGEGGGIRQRTF